MSEKPPSNNQKASVSRREFLTVTGAGIATATGATVASADTVLRAAGAMGKSNPRVTAPFDSLRDYVAALEQHGLLMHFDAIDQDAYEGTAIMYRLVDIYGRFRAPIVMFERVKIAGRWMDGPVIANELRHVDVEAILFGLEPVPNDGPATWQRARVHLDNMLQEAGGEYPTIEPVELARFVGLEVAVG